MNCIHCEIFTTCDAKVDVTTTDDLLYGEGVRYVPWPWADRCPKWIKIDRAKEIGGNGPGKIDVLSLY